MDINQTEGTREAGGDAPGEEPDRDDAFDAASEGGHDPEQAGAADGRWLDRFPEALDAAADPTPEAPASASVLAFKVLFYAGMAVGVIASLALVAAVFFQGWVATNFIQAGGDYLGSGPEAQTARDVLGIPLAGFVVVLLAGFAALSVGAVGVLRGRR